MSILGLDPHDAGGAYSLTGAPDCRIASFSNRVPGFALDLLIVVGAIVVSRMVGLVVFFVLYVASGRNPDSASSFLRMMVVIPAIALAIAAVLIPLLYNKVYLVSKRGATLGQRITKLRVIDSKGQNLAPRRALLRFLLEVGFVCIPFVPLLDLLWPIYPWSGNLGQTLHDKAVGAYVVYPPDTGLRT